MSKIDLGTAKYIVHAKIETSGIIEKPDVVGAVFGQTEGLLGDELDLRELQKTGRIGRIEVHIESQGGRCRGEIKLPSSMDKVETAILAAALETIDRVGPCEARITVQNIEDVRVSKRKKVIERAKNILGTMVEDITPDSLELTEEVKESIRLGELVNYGKENLPAGPNIDDSDAIIVVEGRADVLTLLRHGIKNAIAVEGTSVPSTIVELTKKKTSTVFTDGDRGGELIVKELLQVAEVDFVARAPEGKEVEELTRKEIFKALRNKVPAEQALAGIPRQELRERPHAREQRPMRAESQPKIEQQKTEVRKAGENKDLDKFKKLFKDLSGTLKAYLLDKDVNIIKEVAVRDLAVALKNSKDRIYAVIFDGVITQRLVDISTEKSVEYLVGAKIGNIIKRPIKLKLVTAKNITQKNINI